MKIRGLLVAALVFLVLAGVLYWSQRHQPNADLAKNSDTPPAILKLDQGAITRLEIEKKDAEPLLLSRNPSGDWQIDKPQLYRADQSAVSTILSAVASLNSERLVDEKAASLDRYGLGQPAVQIGITTRDKTQKLLVGDDTPTGGAVYAALAGDPRVFTIASYSKSSLDKSLNDLRDKRLLTVDLDKISRIELLRKNQDIEFGRGKDEWQILNPKPLRADSADVDALARILTEAKMDLSDSDESLAATFAKAAPVATVRLTHSSGTQQVEIRKNKDTYYAKSSVADGVHKVGSDLGQAVDKGLDDFRNKKLFDFGFSDPDKIELHAASAAYFFTRGGEDWWSNGKKMDADGVQSLVSALRDLTASKFVESGFSNPELQATVTSNDGKKTEKLSISKAGDQCIARRENEMSLYVLGASAIDDLRKAAEQVKPAASTPPRK